MTAWSASRLAVAARREQASPRSSPRPASRGCGADLRVGVLAGDHLALLGDADLAADAARRLREDRLVARAAAAPDVPPRPWKRRRRTPCRGEHAHELDLGLVQLPARRSGSRRPCCCRSSRASPPARRRGSTSRPRYSGRPSRRSMIAPQPRRSSMVSNSGTTSAVSGERPRAPSARTRPASLSSRAISSRSLTPLVFETMQLAHAAGAEAPLHLGRGAQDAAAPTRRARRSEVRRHSGRGDASSRSSSSRRAVLVERRVVARDAGAGEELGDGPARARRCAGGGRAARDGNRRCAPRSAGRAAGRARCGRSAAAQRGVEDVEIARRKAALSAYGSASPVRAADGRTRCPSAARGRRQARVDADQGAPVGLVGAVRRGVAATPRRAPSSSASTADPRRSHRLSSAPSSCVSTR